ncbi:hypothetical protein LSAT2_001807 [Lamellibrachia satsuma]|nr:hypothetical protein LSAT2_001807 [Lamellibrachia satsuma]
MGIVQIGQRRDTLNLFSITNSFVCLLDLINLARITHRIGYTDTYTCVSVKPDNGAAQVTDAISTQITDSISEQITESLKEQITESLKEQITESLKEQICAQGAETFT